MTPGDYIAGDVDSLLSRLDSAQAWLGIISLFLAGSFLVLLAASRVRTVDVRPMIIVAWSLCGVVLLGYLRIFTELHDDEPIWHGLAMEAAEVIAGETSEVVGLREGREGYTWLGGSLYALFGPAPILLIIVNCLALGVWIVATSRVTEMFVMNAGIAACQARRAVRASAWLIAVTPTILIWVPQILRETLAGMLVALGCWGAMGLATTKRKKYLALMAGSILILFWLRATMGLGVAAGLVGGLVLGGKVSGRLRSAKRLVTIVFICTLFGLSAVGLDVISQLDPTQRSVDLAFLSRTAASGYADESIYGASPYTATLLVNLPRTLFGPFPWELDGSAVMLLSLVDGIAWWAAGLAALWWMLRGRKAMVTEVEQAAPLHRIFVALAASLVFVFTVGVSNYGMLARLRPIAFACLVPFLALYLARNEKDVGVENGRPEERRPHGAVR